MADSENSNLPATIATSDQMMVLWEYIKDLSLTDDQQALFKKKLSEEMKDFQAKVLQAFPDHEFVVVGWSKNPPEFTEVGGHVYYPPPDAKPRYYIDVYIPMGNYGRLAKVRKLGARLIIYDENEPHKSLWHKVLQWVKWQGKSRG